MHVSHAAETRPSRYQRLPFFYGWVIVAAAGLGMFASAPGQTYAFSVFLDPVIEDLGWSRTLISSLYFFGSLTAAGIIVGVGRLLDKFGARVMLGAVAIVFGGVLIGMSRVQHPVEMYLGFTAIRTLGQGSLSLIPITLVSLWFIRIRGKALALTALGAAAASGVFPPVIHVLISSFGWRDAWIMLAFIVWGLLLLPSLLLVRRSPESVGLLPDGDTRPSSRSGQRSSSARRGDQRSMPATGADSPAPSSPDRGEQRASLAPQADSPAPSSLEHGDQWVLREALRTRTLWLLLIAGSSQSLISTALMFHQVSLLSEKGLDAGTAATIFSVIAPMIVIGQFLSGYLADRLPNRFLLAGGQITLASAMLVTFGISAPWHAFFYGGLLGVSAGFLMNTTNTIWPNYFGRRNLGSIRSVANVGMMASAALGPLPFGALFDATSSFDVAVLIFLSLPVLAGTAALMATPPRKR